MNATRARVGALFALFFGLYALTSSGNAFRVPDEFEVYFQAEHLVDAGDISVPQTLAIVQNGQPIFFGKIGRDGRPYAPYGPAVAVLVAPFHVVGRLVASAAGVRRRPLPEGIAWEFLVGGITTLAAACAAALAVAGAFRAFGGLGATDRRALGLALLLGCCTILWPYATTLYSEAWLAAAFAWAAALLLDARNRTGQRRPHVVAAAGLLALAGLTKPTALVIAPAFVVAALLDPVIGPRERWQTAIALAAGIGVGALAQIGWNVERFGAPLDFDYNLGAMVVEGPARAFALADVPRGLAVQLFSPGKSMFLWAPPTVLALVVTPRAFARERGVVAGLACGTIAALVFYAAFLYPEGGYAHGPRHLVPLVPLWLLPLALPGIPLRKPLLIGCAAVGLVVALLAVSVSFLEDQAPPQRDPRSTGPYYERITPPSGRPWNRYRLDYVPFVTALGSGHWLDARRPPGDGPDFFVVHLARARRLMPGGLEIPTALPWCLAAFWIAVLLWGGVAFVGSRPC